MSRDAHVDGAVSDYREFPAPFPLASHLLCLWTQSIVGSDREYAHRVLPDGCIDVVFINGDPPILVGPWTKPFVARLAAGTKIVGARWHPGRAPSLLGVPAPELLNQSVPLSALWGSARNSELAQIADQPGLAARRSALAQSLLSRLAGAAPIDQAVSASIRWLSRHPHGRIEQLSQWIGISPRHLQRRFSAAVGYGPKTFQSVLRFQRLLNLAGGNSAPRTLVELSADAGYADQAHMTREVGRFSGIPPAVLLPSAQCTLRMSNFFQTAPDSER